MGREGLGSSQEGLSEEVAVCSREDWPGADPRLPACAAERQRTRKPPVWACEGARVPHVVEQCPASASLAAKGGVHAGEGPGTWLPGDLHVLG